MSEEYANYSPLEKLQRLIPDDYTDSDFEESDDESPNGWQQHNNYIQDSLSPYNQQPTLQSIQTNQPPHSNDLPPPPFNQPPHTDDLPPPPNIQPPRLGQPGNPNFQHTPFSNQPPHFNNQFPHPNHQPPHPNNQPPRLVQPRHPNFQPPRLVQPRHPNFQPTRFINQPPHLHNQHSQPNNLSNQSHPNNQLPHPNNQPPHPNNQSLPHPNHQPPHPNNQPPRLDQPRHPNFHPTRSFNQPPLPNNQPSQPNNQSSPHLSDQSHPNNQFPHPNNQPPHPNNQSLPHPNHQPPHPNNQPPRLDQPRHPNFQPSRSLNQPLPNNRFPKPNNLAAHPNNQPPYPNNQPPRPISRFPKPNNQPPHPNNQSSQPDSQQSRPLWSNSFKEQSTSNSKPEQHRPSLPPIPTTYDKKGNSEEVSSHRWPESDDNRNSPKPRPIFPTDSKASPIVLKRPGPFQNNPKAPISPFVNQNFPRPQLNNPKETVFNARHPIANHLSRESETIRTPFNPSAYNQGLPNQALTQQTEEDPDDDNMYLGDGDDADETTAMKNLNLWSQEEESKGPPSLPPPLQPAKAHVTPSGTLPRTKPNNTNALVNNGRGGSFSRPVNIGPINAPHVRTPGNISGGVAALGPFGPRIGRPPPRVGAPHGALTVPDADMSPDIGDGYAGFKQDLPGIDNRMPFVPPSITAIRATLNNRSPLVRPPFRAPPIQRPPGLRQPDPRTPIVSAALPSQNPALVSRPSLTRPFRKDSIGIPPEPLQYLTLENGASFPSTPFYQLLLNEDYFHLISKDTVANRLKEDKMFLFQPSNARSESNPLSLNIRYEGRVFRFAINKRNDGRYAIGTEKECEDRFASISDMVKHFSRNPLKFEGKLMHFGKPAPKN